MRIALVSPYSWSYPGGVTRHIEALAEQFMAGGHHVRVLAPYDPPDRLSARMHRGARPEARELPGLGHPAGAHDRRQVQRRRLEPPAHAVRDHDAAPRAARGPLRRHPRARAGRPGRGLRRARHDRSRRSSAPSTATPRTSSPTRSATPSAPSASSSACTCASPSPRPPRGPAGASTAAATGSSPTASTCRPSCPAPAPRPQGAPLRLAFVGQAVERKGLPVLLRAFEALRDHVAVELIVVGADRDEVEPLHARRHAGRHRPGQGLRRREGRRPWPRPTCSSRPRWAARASAWCSPRPSPPARRSSPPTSPATATSCATGSTACSSRAATPPPWPRRCATSPWRPSGARPWPSRRARTRRATPGRRSPARSSRPTRTPSPCRGPPPPASAPACSSAPSRPISGRAGPPSGACPASRPPSARAATAAARPPARPASASPGSPPAFLALLALQRIGLDQIGDSLLRATPTWVLLGLGLMCGSMVVRGVAWHAILTAALPEARLRRSDALQGTFIGVLMSATLPARLGEPSRALIVARRTGPPARPPADRRGLDRLADAAQRRRAGRPGDRHVLDGRPLQPAPARPRGLRDRADGRARRRARAARAAARRRAVALAPRPGGAWPRCAPRSPRCAPACASSARPSSAPRRPRCSSAPGSSSGCRATCCSSRSGSTTAPGSAPPRRCSSRST